MITDAEKQSIEMMYPSRDVLSNRDTTQLNWYRDLAPFPLVDNSAKGMDPAARNEARTVDEFHCKMFDMTKEEDVALYSIVKQRILSGWYTQCKELVKWEDTPLFIWLEWIQSYKEI